MRAQYTHQRISMVLLRPLGHISCAVGLLDGLRQRTNSQPTATYPGKHSIAEDKLQSRVDAASHPTVHFPQTSIVQHARSQHTQ